MLSSFLSAARRYIADVQSATSLVRDPSPCEVMLWDFSKPHSVAQWDCLSDQEMEGQSDATFQGSDKGYATFSGCLSTELPPGRDVLYSGYAAIRSRPAKKRLFLYNPLDLSRYDALELCLRGDGRRYIANLQAPGLARKDDLWQCLVYTRGGPLWECLRLPFADFLLTHRGYLQDHQMSVPRQYLSTVGLLLADRTTGPFHLDIRYIKAIETFTKTAPI